MTQTIHSGDLEQISEIHRMLNEMNTVNPVVSARSGLEEIITEAETVPDAVRPALDVISGDDVDVGDAQEAADLLRPVLEGTAYDPDDPDGFYPDY